MEFASRDDATEWIINNQFGRRNLSDYQRGVLALRMKPIIEKRADAARIAGNAIGGKSSLISDATPDIFTEEAPAFALTETPTPAPAIRTDAAVASLANLGKDTIRKIERIEEVAAPEVKALAAAGDVSINLASQFVALPEEVQQEAIAAIAEHNEPAKEVMREAVHNHRAQGTSAVTCPQASGQPWPPKLMSCWMAFGLLWKCSAGRNRPPHRRGLLHN